MLCRLMPTRLNCVVVFSDPEMIVALWIGTSWPVMMLPSDPADTTKFGDDRIFARPLVISSRTNVLPWRGVSGINRE